MDLPELYNMQLQDCNPCRTQGNTSDDFLFDEYCNSDVFYDLCSEPCQTTTMPAEAYKKFSHWMDRKANELPKFLFSGKTSIKPIHTPHMLSYLDGENIWSYASIDKGIRKANRIKSQRLENDNCDRASDVYDSDTSKVDRFDEGCDNMCPGLKDCSSCSDSDMDCKKQPDGFSPLRPDANFYNCDSFSGMVHLCPAKKITFMKEQFDSCSGRFLSELRIANVTCNFVESGGRSIAYKIKTNAPCKYYVKPSMGTLQVGDQDILHASLDENMADEDICRDRFLILYTYIDDICEDLNIFWKRKECSGDYNQHRMKVEFLNPGITPGGCLPSGDLQPDSPGNVCCGSGLCGKDKEEEDDCQELNDACCPEPVCSPCNDKLWVDLHKLGDKLKRVEVTKQQLCRMKRLLRHSWKFFFFVLLVFALYWKMTSCCSEPIDIVSPTTRSDCNHQQCDVTKCKCNYKEQPNFNMCDDAPFNLGDYDVTNESNDNADDLPFFIPFLNN